MLTEYSILCCAFHFFSYSVHHQCKRGDCIKVRLCTRLQKQRGRATWRNNPKIKHNNTFGRKNLETILNMIYCL